MGKGDKKSKRGKLFRGSFGVRRPKKSPHKVKTPEVKKPIESQKTKEKIKSK